ncbi:hypothetical protein Hypma_016625 [Hypsizygus marmoreus]|uniref:Uncharacterized protein n=1 Tax=Hypsizygus marmoreus TaxID=39966 RepID=A0A369IXJ9_HYPMA|nr:hypothetical protein Hypma_016625 [Hypsizygus marmoreus]
MTVEDVPESKPQDLWTASQNDERRTHDGRADLHRGGKSKGRQDEALNNFTGTRESHHNDNGMHNFARREDLSVAGSNPRMLDNEQLVSGRQSNFVFQPQTRSFGGEASQAPRRQDHPLNPADPRQFHTKTYSREDHNKQLHSVAQERVGPQEIHVQSRSHYSQDHTRDNQIPEQRSNPPPPHAYTQQPNRKPTSSSKPSETYPDVATSKVVSASQAQPPTLLHVSVDQVKPCLEIPGFRAAVARWVIVDSGWQIMVRAGLVLAANLSPDTVVAGPVNDRSLRTATEWISEWLSIRANTEHPREITVQHFGPPQQLAQLEAQDWSHFSRAGAKSIFRLLHGLHDCYYRRNTHSTLTMSASEWSLWVKDLHWAFSCMLQILKLHPNESVEQALSSRRSSSYSAPFAQAPVPRADLHPSFGPQDSRAEHMAFNIRPSAPQLPAPATENFYPTDRSRDARQSTAHGAVEAFSWHQSTTMPGPPTHSLDSRAAFYPEIAHDMRFRESTVHIANEGSTLPGQGISTLAPHNFLPVERSRDIPYAADVIAQKLPRSNFNSSSISRDSTQSIGHGRHFSHPSDMTDPFAPSSLPPVESYYPVDGSRDTRLTRIPEHGSGELPMDRRSATPFNQPSSLPPQAVSFYPVDRSHDTRESAPNGIGSQHPSNITSAPLQSENLVSTQSHPNDGSCDTESRRDLVVPRDLNPNEMGTSNTRKRAREGEEENDGVKKTRLEDISDDDDV